MNNYSILIVDDEEIVLKAIGSRLKKKGYDIHLINDSQEAVDLFADKSNSSAEVTNFDLVITDLMMVGKNGIDVLEQVKRSNPETLVMILTGFGDLETAIEALRLGADEYLLKTCKSDELFFRVAKCLEKLEYQRKIKLYENIIPVCCVCKKIRDDTGKIPGNGDWFSMEEYFREKAQIGVSHTYCEGCADTFRKKLATHR